jgi:hypothetical protein
MHIFMGVLAPHDRVFSPVTKKLNPEPHILGTHDHLLVNLNPPY